MENNQSIKELIKQECPDCSYVDCICYEEDFEEEEICGYECLGCGNIQKNAGLGFRCNRCCGGTINPIYF